MTDLMTTPCQACDAQARALPDTEWPALLAQLPGWAVQYRDGIAQLEREYRFKNFRQALAFTQAVGACAEAENHHPALLTEWGKVTVSWWSHSLKGLHRNDFIMAARTDALAR